MGGGDALSPPYFVELSRNDNLRVDVYFKFLSKIFWCETFVVYGSCRRN